MLAEQKLDDLLEAVAAKKPTPGGGSVSAAVGALGAALGVMTARFSDNHDAELALEAARVGLLKLVDADAEAYGQVASAMALPKATDEEKKRRKEVLQNALVEAADVPLKGMDLALSGLEALAALAPVCNRYLVSDLSSSAHFLEAALVGCGENVKVNAASMADKERGGALVKEHDARIARGATLRKSIQTGAAKARGGK